MSPLVPYERLVELAERESALVGSRAWEDLAAIAEERQAIVAALPSPPPAAAGPVLERLASAQALVSASIAAARSEVASELSSLDRSRGAVRGYGASATPAAAGHPRLDRAA